MIQYDDEKNLGKEMMLISVGDFLICQAIIAMLEKVDEVEIGVEKISPREAERIVSRFEMMGYFSSFRVRNGQLFFYVNFTQEETKESVEDRINDAIIRADKSIKEAAKKFNETAVPVAETLIDTGKVILGDALDKLKKEVKKNERN